MTHKLKLLRDVEHLINVWHRFTKGTRYLSTNFTQAMDRVRDTDKVVSLAAGADWKNEVESAVECLKGNGIIAVPTDTIYGIAGLAQSTPALERIYSIKNRSTMKPVAICVGDVTDVDKWAKVTVSQTLLRELLPGPVTTVFERTVALNPSLNPGTSLVGVRVPDYGFVREVTRECREPLALTSANISSKQSTLNTHEFSEIWPQLDLIFDGGCLGTEAESRLGSTVVDLSKAGYFTVIRTGSAYVQTRECLLRYGLTEEKKS